MNNFNEVEKNLKIILKKGDLLDVIAKRSNKYLPKNSFLKLMILIFSRILYIGVFFCEKFMVKLAPLQKVKNAQDYIRNILGFPVDIIRSISKIDILKFFNKPYLSILYENEGVNRDTYIEHLSSILRFCKLHKIPEVSLNESDIIKLNIKLVDGAKTNFLVYKSKHNNIDEIIKIEKSKTEDELEGILKIIERKVSLDLLCLDLGELEELINILKSSKLDNDTLLEFSEKIEDLVVKRGISEFLKDNDLNKLKLYVQNRLMLNINSDNSYKDKIHGVVFQNVEINGEYVKIITKNKNGIIIENRVTTLYDYLEVLDYQSLLNKIELFDDNHEILCISALYFYISSNLESDFDKINNNYMSLYDCYLKAYIQKSKKEFKKAAGLYTLYDKLNCLLYSLMIGAFLALTIAGILYGSLYLVDAVRTTFFNLESLELAHSLDKNIMNIYIKAWSYEKTFWGKVGSLISSIDLDYDMRQEESTTITNNDWLGYSNKIVGDVDRSITTNEEVLARVIPLKEGIDLPTYYANSISTSANYYDGSLKFFTNYGTLDYLCLEDVEPLFEIRHDISKEYIERNCFFRESDFVKTIYPVGDEYVITKVEIVDKNDTSKSFIKESVNNGYFLNAKEIDLLQSMDNPMICYTYGMGKENSFVEHMFNEFLGGTNYTSCNSDEVRNAIIKGLGLESYATNKEIFTAIKNKYYSTTPIKDAGLTNEIKTLDELEYYETIASLDSLVCNIAASLAVLVDDELIYISGYSSIDEYITVNEAHAWAMDLNGNIIDITPYNLSPYKKFEKSVNDFFKWIVENKLPIYASLFIVSLFLYKKFGKKVKFVFRIEKTKHMLNNPNFGEYYAILRDMLYGGINLASERKPSEFVNVIKNEFAAYSKEDLQKIKEELKQAKLYNDKEFLGAWKLIDEIPFIVENSDVLKRKLTKEDKE